MKGISEILKELEIEEKRRIEKLEQMKANKGAIEYWDDHGDGGFWKPLTEKVAAEDYPWTLDELRVNLYYLVKTDTGIRVLNKEEYETFMGNTQILYQGSLQACKDFIKV